MMVSIAIVLGFKNEIRQKVSGFSAQLTVYPVEHTLTDIHTLAVDDSLRATILSAIPEAKIDPVIELPGILKTDSAFHGAILRALPSDAKGYEFIRENMVEGSMPADSTSEIVISAPVASILGLSMGDRLDIHFITARALRSRRVTISGIYDSHFGEYDKRFFYCAPSLARSIARIPGGEFTSVEINSPAIEDVEASAADLYGALLARSADTRQFFAIDNISRSGMAYFSWLDLLDTNVVVILVLMTLVSGFTLISSMFILILERVRTIGILKSLGASNSQVRGIFIWMAQRLVVRGLVIGNIIALGLIILQDKTHFIPLNPDAYFLSFVPVEVSIPSIIILNVAVIAISALILILPSHVVATLSPAQSMRYE